MKAINIVYWPFVCLWFLISAFPIILAPLTGDESCYFYLASFMKKGGIFFGPYWLDDKPGGLELLFRMILFFNDGIKNFYTIRLFTVVYHAVTMGVFYLLCNRIFSDRRWVARAILPVFILLYLNPLVEGQYSNTNNFVVLWILLAAYFFTVSRHLFTALSIGVCFCLKQNTALEVLPSSLTLIGQELYNLTLPLGLRLKRAAAMPLKQMAMFFVPIGVLILYTVYLHTSEYFFKVAFLDRIQSHILHKDYQLAGRYFIPIFKQTSILWLGFFGFAVGYILRIFLKRAKEDASTVADNFKHYAFLWVVMASISVWVGGYFFPHYFIEITPILVLAAVLFLIEVPSYGFYVVLCLSMLFTQKFGWFTNLIIILVPLFMVFVEPRIRVHRAVLRIALIFVSLLLTLQVTPVNAMAKLIKSKNFFAGYSNNDIDLLAAARYMKRINADKVFAYDYSPQFYCLSGIVPEFEYPAKQLYVNYAKLIKNNLNYVSDDKLLKARRDKLIGKISRGEFNYILINFNIILPGEEVELGPIVKSMALYQPEKIVGNIWIYKLVNSGNKAVISGVESEFRSKVERVDDALTVYIDRTAFVADTEAALSCGNVHWHYPENGIIYPMSVVQDQSGIRVQAVLRGLSSGDCSLTLKNIFREKHLDIRIPPVR